MLASEGFCKGGQDPSFTTKQDFLLWDLLSHSNFVWGSATVDCNTVSTRVPRQLWTAELDLWFVTALGIALCPVEPRLSLQAAHASEVGCWYQLQQCLQGHLWFVPASSDLFWPITAGGCVRGLDANLQEMACWSQHIAISSAMHRSAEFAMHDFLKNCNGPRKPYNVAKEGVTNRMCSLYFVRCYAAGASYFANLK